MCGLRIVADLRATGHVVTYHELEGGHACPPSMVRRALDEVLSAPPPIGNAVTR